MDFTDLKGYTVARKDHLTVAELATDPHAEGFKKLDNEPFLVVGKAHYRGGPYIDLHAGTYLGPQDYLNFQQQAYQHPTDFLRCYYAYIADQRPNELMPIKITTTGYSEMYDLDPAHPARIFYVEQHVDELLRGALSDVRMKERLVAAAKATATSGHEQMFSCFRNPLLHDTSSEFLYTIVHAGTGDSTDPSVRWRQLLRDSGYVTHLDFSRKHNLPDDRWDTIYRYAADHPEVEAEIRSLEQNEWELLAANHSNFLTGPLNGSVVERPDIEAGWGYYRYAIVHSHPIIDPHGVIEPSQADLQTQLGIRHHNARYGPPSYDPLERVAHDLVSIIIQPADGGGEKFHGLIIRPFEINFDVASIISIPDDLELVRRYQTDGVEGTLKNLGFNTARFLFSAGRLYPTVDRILNRLSH